MADHIITLTDKQENAAAGLVTRRNTDPYTGQVTGTLTVDKLLKQAALEPIKAEIEYQNQVRINPIVIALPDATNTQINQINAILGIV